MREMNDERTDLGVEAKKILGEALRALELERATKLIGDVSLCLTTSRVRLLAETATIASVHEQRHANVCLRCHSRIRSFQGAKMKSADHVREASLLKAREHADTIPPRWVAHAEKHARSLFDLLRDEHGGIPSSPLIWPISHTVAQELQNVRDEGAPPSVSAYLVGTSLGVVAAVAHDVLTPWSFDFDSAWPMFELLREAAKEACLAGESARREFVRSYARVAIGAPTHLKAVLVDGIDSLAESVQGGRELASALLNEVLLDKSAATKALGALPSFLRRGAQGEVDPAIWPFVAAWRRGSDELDRASVHTAATDEVVELVEATLQLFFARLASPSDDPSAPLLQLRVVRRYIEDLLVAIRHLESEKKVTLLRAAAEPLIAYARDERSPVFVAMEASRAFALESLPYAEVLSSLLSIGRADLRHAVVVALRKAYEAMPSPDGRFVARYEQYDGQWIFATPSSHPLDEPAAELAQLAASHPDLADSFKWFNDRVEPTAKSEPSFI